MAVSEQDRQQAIEAFEKVATPQQKQKVGEVSDAVLSVTTAAQAIEVRTALEAAHATEFLARLAREKKQADEARVFLVKPLNDHVKAINARFKPTAEMLDQADQLVRSKVIAYRQEQERLRAEEQARLDRERAERERLAEEARRAEEARARAEREAAAREAARAEAEARAAERRRQEELQRQANELERRIAAMTDDELRRTTGAADERGPAAQRELERRRQAREAQERAAAARAREDEARAAEQAARDRPLPEAPRAIAAPAAPLASPSGRVAERKVWRATVVDENAIPRQFLRVDQAAINAAVRAGARQIPGVRVEQVDELAVRAS
jgi:hypothetical protein